MGEFKYNPKIQAVTKKIATEFKFSYGEPTEPKQKIELDSLCSKGGDSCLHSIARATNLAMKYKSAISKHEKSMS